MHVYEVRPRKDKRGVDLISDALPFGTLWYVEVSDAIEYAKHRSRSHYAVIRVYDDAGNVIETHEHAGDFREPQECSFGSFIDRPHEPVGMQVCSLQAVRSLSAGQ
jgi:hypothetical protein